MKSLTCAALAGLFMLAGCESMGRPYIAGDDGCDEIVNPRDRLDCHEASEQAEDDWREEKRREQEEDES